MSQQAFAEFYEEFLTTPEGEELREMIDGITDPVAFCEAAVEGGRANGFDFDLDDVRAVMRESEMAMARELAEAEGELDEDALETVVGGASLSSFEIPKITIRSIGNFSGSLSANTVMCAW